MKNLKISDLTSEIIDGIFGKILINGKSEINSKEKILPVINVIDNEVVVNGFVKQNKKTERNIIKKGDIILSKLANVGKPYIFDLPDFKIGVLSTNFIRISPNYDKVDSKTLYYYLKSLKLKKYWERKSNISLTTSHISLNQVKDIEFSIEENSKDIIDIINLFEEDVKLYEKLLEKEIEKQQFLLDNLLNGTLLSETKTNIKNKKGIKVEVSDKYDLIEKDVVEWQQGIAFTKKDFSETGKKVIRIKDLVNENAEIVFTNKNIKQKYEVTKKDKIICFTGTKESKSIGKVSTGFEGYINNELFKFNSKDETIVLTDYLYFYFKTNFFRKNMFKYSEGMTLLHCKKVKDNLIIFAPNINNQKKMVKILKLQEETISDIKKILNNKRKILKHFSLKLLKNK